MRCTPALVTVTLALLSLPALPQQPTATSSIEGIIVRSDTGQPIPNAQVVLSSVPGPEEIARLDAQSAAGNTAVAPRPAYAPVGTGPDGKFTFKDLQAGPYRVVATANGFIRQEYGQRAVNGQGRTLYLTAGQAFQDTVIRLIPTGTVSGRIYDQSGQPATGAPVQLLRASFNFQGNKAYPSAGNAVVDDRGDYRIFGVAPGRYYLVAGTLPGPAALRGLLSLPGGPTTRFSVVYYPNSTGLDQASSIEVKPQGEATVDMRVTRQTKTFTVRGRIVDGTGAGIPQNLNIMLGWRSFNSGGAAVGARTVDAVTGAFEMQNVPPGEYTVQAQLAITGAAALAARRGGQASEPGASVPIRVVDSDIEGLVLTLTTGSAITGRVVVDGRPVSSVPNLDKQRIILENLAASSGMLAIPSSVAIAADGTFQLNSMREGEYRLQMAVPGFYVKGVKYGGDEILGKPFKVSGNGSETLEVTLRASTATASGTVSDSKTLPVSGVNVVFAPADRNRVDLFRTAPTDQNGRYSISNLAPGEYTAFSWESIENYAYFDPEFLRQYEQLGKAIVVSDTTNPRVDLKLIPVQ